MSALCKHWAGRVRGSSGVLGTRLAGIRWAHSAPRLTSATNQSIQLRRREGLLRKAVLQPGQPTTEVKQNRCTKFFCIWQKAKEPIIDCYLPAMSVEMDRYFKLGNCWHHTVPTQTAAAAAPASGPAPAGASLNPAPPQQQQTRARVPPALPSTGVIIVCSAMYWETELGGRLL